MVRCCKTQAFVVGAFLVCALVPVTGRGEGQAPAKDAQHGEGGGAAATDKDKAAALKNIEFLTRKALQQFELIEFDTAKKLLGDAEALCERFAIASYPVCARVYLVQGVLAITGYKDRFAGRKAFVKALTADPRSRLTLLFPPPRQSRSSRLLARRPRSCARPRRRHRSRRHPSPRLLRRSPQKSLK